MPPCRRRCPGPAGPVAHSLRPKPPAPHDELDFSTGYSPWPHPTTALTRPTTTTANFAQTQFPSFSLRQILTSPAIPTPSRFTSPKTQLSRPLENCEGYPVLAGVRNLGLDDPSAGVQIYIAISASAAAGPRRAAAARRAESLKRGCTGRTVRRAEWQALAECVARGGEHAATAARSWQASQASGAAALAGRRARTRTRRAGSHPPRSPLQPALEQRPDPGLTARGL